MKAKRLQATSPYLSPAASPRATSPQPSVPGKPGGFYGDRLAASHTASRTLSPPSSSSSSLSSVSRSTTPVTMASSGSARPTSVAVLSAANRPTLQDILSNSAPPPWTLGAFMAYLSQNHCMETLEFTMEADRYKEAFAQLQHAEGGAAPAHWSQDAREQCIALWQKLINAYILPYGPREVNLPGPVRDRLLRLNPTVVPPHPNDLNEAVRIVFDLMNDSVLLPFLDSVSQEQHQFVDGCIDDMDARQGRSRRRVPNDSSYSRNSDNSRSPKAFLPQINLGRKAEGRSPSSSADDADRIGLVDDNGGTPPPDGEPLTPPTTPPTSDWGFGTSPPNTLQRAITVHNAGWKRMSAKLGLSRKGRNPSRKIGSGASSSNNDRRSTEPTSAMSPTTDDDVPMSGLGHAPTNSL